LKKGYNNRIINNLYKFSQVLEQPKGVYNDVIKEQGVDQNTWQTGVYQQQVD
jgi:hypothetical protein